MAHSTWHVKLTITDQLKPLPPIPVDLSLFEDGIFVDVLKTKSLGWPLIQYDGHPYKKRELWGHTHTHIEEDAIWTEGHVEKSMWPPRQTWNMEQQATLWTDGHFQKLGGGKQMIYQESQREHGLADNLVSDIWTPELWESKFLVFSVTQLVALHGAMIPSLCHRAAAPEMHAVTWPRFLTFLHLPMSVSVKWE